MALQSKQWVLVAGLLAVTVSAACAPVTIPLIQTDGTTASAGATTQSTPEAAPADANPTPTPSVSRAAGPQTVAVKRDTITETVTLDGTVVAQSQAPVSFQQKGIVDQVDVKPGQVVSEGDVLIDLASDDIQHNLDTANTGLQTAQQNLVQGQSTLQAMEDAATDKAAATQRQQQQSIADAQAGLRRAQDNLAQVQAGRPASERQAQETAVQSGQAQVSQAQAGLDAVNAGPDPAAVSAAQKDVNNDQIALAKAQSDLDTLTRGADPDTIRAAQAQVQKAQTQLQLAQSAKVDPKLDPSVARVQHDASIQDAQIALQTAQANLDKVKQPPAATDVQTAQQGVQDAQNALDSAQNKLAAVQAGPDPTAVAQARGVLDGANHYLAEAQANLAGVNSHPTPAELADAQDQVRRAQTALDNAEQPLAPVTLDGAPDLGALQAAVDQAQAQVDAQQSALDASHLRAPSDGTIVSIRVKPGDKLTVGQPVVILAQPGAPLVRADLDDSQVSRVAAGQQATIQLDSSTTATSSINATVSAVSPDAASGPFADLQVTWPDGQLPRLGTPVQVVVTLDQKQNVLVVPKSAVRQAGGRASVEVQDGTLRHLVSVQVGASTADSVEIVSGLSEGQLVLTRAS